MLIQKDPIQPSSALSPTPPLQIATVDHPSHLHVGVAYSSDIEGDGHRGAPKPSFHQGCSKSYPDP